MSFNLSCSELIGLSYHILSVKYIVFCKEKDRLSSVLALVINAEFVEYDLQPCVEMEYTDCPTVPTVAQVSFLEVHLTKPACSRSYISASKRSSLAYPIGAWLIIA